MSIPPTPKVPPADPDPSMDDILASIRRILDDDQATKEPGADVLMLDQTMLVAPEVNASEVAAVSPTPPLGAAHAASGPAAHEALDAVRGDNGTARPAPESVQPQFAAPPPVVPDEKREMARLNEDFAASPNVSRDSLEHLVAPAAAAAAANSVGALMRTLAAERNAAVSRSGATIEDLVREEVRPFLKDWLDAHLAPIVERLVQAEIERVVARQAG